MCGIVGLASLSSATLTDKNSLFKRALDSIHHRGPDCNGEYRTDSVWLGHTRLSILDLSDAGNQPMKSSNERYVLSYNGEVYNFRELAREEGFDELQSCSDTEVVLRLFSRYGIKSLSRLNGMFAFAILDTQEQNLWLVRDRLGIKPLYICERNETLAFASELSAINVQSDGPGKFDLTGLHEWLYYGNALGGKTLYRDIRQVRPGHYLEVDLSSGKITDHAYWSLRKQSQNKTAIGSSRQKIISRTGQLLETAVRRQLVSDVPVGLFLSGGIDSSAIAAFASRHYEGRLATYSVGFDFAPDAGELPRAKRVAQLYGTEHHELQISGRDVGELVEKLVAHHGMPFSDAANIPLYLMASQISSHTKVVLQGDGGDELFGGYRRYATTKFHTVLRPLARLIKPLHGMTARSATHYRVQRYLKIFAAEDMGTIMALMLTPEMRDGNALGIFDSDLAKRIDEASDPFAHYRETQSLFQDLDISNQMSMIDLAVILPDTFLEKVDRSTMAASLEVRVPFLDNDLVDYVIGLSGRQKISYGRKKWLLKEALKGVVPDEVLFGQKRGLSVPYGYWLQTSLKTMFFDHLQQFNRMYPKVLNVEHVQRLFDRTKSGRENHAALLWKTLNFVIWANISRFDFSQSIKD